MTIHRFFVDSITSKGKNIFFHGDTAKQITKVLRLKEGDRVMTLDNKGYEYLVRLNMFISGQVTGTILKKQKNLAEPEVFVTLYQALTSRDKFELILQKCTEIGISKFVPVETKRSLLKVKDIKKDRLERFQKIIQEASEQTERGRIPQILEAVKFEDALDLVENDYSIIAWEDEKKNPIKDVLKNIPMRKNISIFIGPEGGFEETEIKLAKKMGVLPVSLGPRILRTETAAIAFSSLALL